MPLFRRSRRAAAPVLPRNRGLFHRWPLLQALILLVVPAAAFGQVFVHDEVQSADGSERLVLYYARDTLVRRVTGRGWEFDPDRPGELREASGWGADFHSLVWEARDGTRWHRRVALGEWRMRRAGCEFAIGLHSLDAARGEAIIKMALRNDGPDKVTMLPSNCMDPTTLKMLVAAGLDPQQPVRVERLIRYAWVRWDLRANRLLARLQVCEDPFDKYTPEA